MRRTEPEEGPAERAYDEFLDAAMRGETPDIDAFCALHPDASGALRVWLEGFLAMLHADRPVGEDVARIVAERRPGPMSEGALPCARLGEFRLLRRLGEGGMGIVYLAEQEPLHRLVALKTLHPERSLSTEAQVRFYREAQAIGRLRHPGIVTIFATGEEQGIRYLAMELVPGRGLDELLRERAERGERLAPARALGIAAELARALECAHSNGIVHRDVKPSNVRVTPDGHAMLVDFGLARDVEESRSLTRELVGTACYCAPEQVQGGERPVDARCDVYSLGVTLYECLTGRVPFDGETTEELFHNLLTREPPPPRALVPELTRDLETVVLTAMEKEPARRYPSAEVFAQDLEAVLELRPIRARPAGFLTRWLRWLRPNPWPGATVLLLVALAQRIAFQ